MISVSKITLFLNNKKSIKLRLGFFGNLYPLALLLLLYFCQVWVDIANITIRTEDILLLLLVGQIALSALVVFKLSYRVSSFNVPLLLWSAIILISVLLTLLQPFDSTTKKDAFVNGIRLLLGISVFFVVYNYPAPALQKIKLVFSVVIGFSFITTTVSLLQIAYWEGILPFALPKILITKAEGSNNQIGREIFGLFIGDTSAHSWAAMVAIQALVVFIFAQTRKPFLLRWGYFAYSGLLTLIIFRMAVRNSLLGLVVTIVGLSILQGIKSRYPLNRIILPTLIALSVMCGLFAFLDLAPDTYYVERARAAIPSFEDGQIVISSGSSFKGRLTYYAMAWDLFLEKPLLGHGYYTFQALSVSYLESFIPHAHNSYLQVLAEYGLVGFVIISWMMLQLVLFLVVLWRTNPIDRYFYMGRKLLTGLMLFLAFTAFFANPIQDPRLLGFIMFVLGGMVSYQYETRQRVLKAITDG